MRAGRPARGLPPPGAGPGGAGSGWCHGYLHDLDELQEQPLPVLGLFLKHDYRPHPVPTKEKTVAEPISSFRLLGGPGAAAGCAHACRVPRACEAPSVALVSVLRELLSSQIGKRPQRHLVAGGCPPPGWGPDHAHGSSGGSRKSFVPSADPEPHRGGEPRSRGLGTGSAEGQARGLRGRLADQTRAPVTISVATKAEGQPRTGTRCGFTAATARHLEERQSAVPLLLQ